MQFIIHLQTGYASQPSIKVSSCQPNSPHSYYFSEDQRITLLLQKLGLQIKVIENKAKMNSLIN